MPKSPIIIGLLFCVWSLSCDPESLTPDDELDVSVVESPIIGGRDTTVERHPWIISLWRNGVTNCSGAILNSEWVATVNHCVDTGEPYFYIVIAGMTNLADLGSVGQAVIVEDIVPHPDWAGSGSNGADLALLKLSTPLDLSAANVSAI